MFAAKIEISIMSQFLTAYAEIENTTKIQVKTDGIFYENVFYPFKETYFPNNSLYSKAIQIARKLKTIISYFK